MSDFTDKGDDLDAAFISIMISATTLLNLYDELSELRMLYETKNQSVWANLRILCPTGAAFRSTRILMRSLSNKFYNFHWTVRTSLQNKQLRA